MVTEQPVGASVIIRYIECVVGTHTPEMFIGAMTLLQLCKHHPEYVMGLLRDIENFYERVTGNPTCTPELEEAMRQFIERYPVQGETSAGP